jgi:copper chaperone
MTTIKIKGMSCNHCVMAVNKALSEVEGVTDINVDLSKGEATFEMTGSVDMGVLREKIKEAGYELI